MVLELSYPEFGSARFKCTLHWRIQGAERCPPPPPASKYFQFHAVFEKIRQNHVSGPPKVSAPTSGKSWIRHRQQLAFKMRVRRRNAIGVLQLLFCTVHLGLRVSNFSVSYFIIYTDPL